MSEEAKLMISIGPDRWEPLAIIAEQTGYANASQLVLKLIDELIKDYPGHVMKQHEKKC
jgi:hypothetical protein